MSLAELLPWLGFGVTAIGLAGTLYKLLVLDRHASRQHDVSAEQAQDMEERKQVLATARFYSEQVPALQRENEARRAEAIVLREQIAACDQRMAAIEANAREVTTALLVRHTDELNALSRELSRVTVRLRKYEPDGGRAAC